MRPINGLFLMIAFAAAGLSGCVREQPSSLVKSERMPLVRQLTANDDVFEANPTYSPDGAWLLFESDETGNRDLWLMPAAGGPRRQLTTDKGCDTAGAWSPDGALIAFESDRTGFRNIWILDPASPESPPVPLTAGPWSDGDPAWSPHGSRIAYESNRQKAVGSEIWMSPAGGGPAVRLTTTGDGIYHRTADWSPDGGRLVFESNREGGYSALFTMDAAGGPAARITPAMGYEGHPAWSPDGQQIVYESGVTGVMEIFAVPAKGGTPVQVTTGGGFWPRWSPDGGSIVYCVFGDAAPNVWVVEADW